MLFYGPLSDKYGRRRLLLGGIILYLTVSIGCMLASSAEWLIAARFLQALGAAAASVLARAIVRDLFPLNEAARVLSLMHIVTMTATLIAPLIGGYLIMISSWRSLFAVLFVFAVLVLLASALHDGTALPMALIIGLTGCGSLAALALTRRPAT